MESPVNPLSSNDIKSGPILQNDEASEKEEPS